MKIFELPLKGVFKDCIVLPEHKEYFTISSTCEDNYWLNEFPLAARANCLLHEGFNIVSDKIFWGKGTALFEMTRADSAGTDFKAAKQEYLACTKEHDYASLEVRLAGAEIQAELPTSHNSGELIDASLRWIQKNIRYVNLPPLLHKLTERKMWKMPRASWHNASELLQACLDLDAEAAGALGKKITLDPLLDTPEIIAPALLYQAGRHMPELGKYWSILGGYTATDALRARMAKCTGFSNILVALCRLFGIPAAETSCIMKVSDGWHEHSITSAHLQGWVEIDPTNTECRAEFDATKYAYRFASSHPTQVIYSCHPTLSAAMDHYKMIQN